MWASFLGTINRSLPTRARPVALIRFSPFAVRGMSVEPVCRPLSDHSVSPWRMMKTLGVVIADSSGAQVWVKPYIKDEALGGPDQQLARHTPSKSYEAACLVWCIRPCWSRNLTQETTSRGAWEPFFVQKPYRSSRSEFLQDKYLERHHNQKPSLAVGPERSPSKISKMPGFRRRLGWASDVLSRGRLVEGLLNTETVECLILKRREQQCIRTQKSKYWVRMNQQYMISTRDIRKLDH